MIPCSINREDCFGRCTFGESSVVHGLVGKNVGVTEKYLTACSIGGSPWEHTDIRLIDITNKITCKNCLSALRISADEPSNEDTRYVIIEKSSGYYYSRRDRSFWTNDIRKATSFASKERAEIEASELVYYSEDNSVILSIDDYNTQRKKYDNIHRHPNGITYYGSNQGPTPYSESEIIEARNKLEELKRYTIKRLVDTTRYEIREITISYNVK